MVTESCGSLNSKQSVTTLKGQKNQKMLSLHPRYLVLKLQMGLLQEL